MNANIFQSIGGFFIDHWATISGIVGYILTRVIPTSKNLDVIKGVVKVIDVIIPNLKKNEDGTITKHN